MNLWRQLALGDLTWRRLLFDPSIMPSGLFLTGQVTLDIYPENFSILRPYEY